MGKIVSTLKEAIKLLLDKQLIANPAYAYVRVQKKRVRNIKGL
jgi:hypothetical protein